VDLVNKSNLIRSIQYLMFYLLFLPSTLIVELSIYFNIPKYSYFIGIYLLPYLLSYLLD
jgi:hypothetical protein